MSFCFYIKSICRLLSLSVFLFFLYVLFFLRHNETALPEWTLLVQSFAPGKAVQCNAEVTFSNPCPMPGCVQRCSLWIPAVFLLIYSSLSFSVPHQITFMKKQRADWSWRMLAVIQCRIFCLPDYYPKMWRLRYTKRQFCLLFSMGVELVKWSVV
jgi:hypothetical protein